MTDSSIRRARFRVTPLSGERIRFEWLDAEGNPEAPGATLKSVEFRATDWAVMRDDIWELRLRAETDD